MKRPPRLKRQLVTDYARTVEELERGLRVDNLDLACAQPVPLAA